MAIKLAIFGVGSNCARSHVFAKHDIKVCQIDEWKSWENSST